MHTDLWIFPRGITRDGGMGEKGIRWTSKYGSVVASVYQAGTADGMNEVYYFEDTSSPSVVWVDLKRVEFSEGSGVRKLDLHGKSVVGDNQTGGFKIAEPFVFLAPEQFECEYFIRRLDLDICRLI